MNESQLSTFLQSRSGDAAKRTWRCPDEAALAAYVDLNLDGKRRRKIEAHVADCDFCLDQVAFLATAPEAERSADAPTLVVPEELLTPARRAGSSPPVTAPVSRARLAWSAAALALVLTLGSQQLFRRQPPTPGESARSAVRSGEPIEARPSIVSPKEGSVIERPAVTFEWQGVDRSLFYRVAVLTAAGDPVWNGRTETTALRLPEEVALAAGATYFVSVEAYLPDGRTSRSPAVGFRIGR